MLCKEEPMNDFGFDISILMPILGKSWHQALKKSQKNIFSRIENLLEIHSGNLFFMDIVIYFDMSKFDWKNYEFVSHNFFILRPVI